jgi:hypothetical protein
MLVLEPAFDVAMVSEHVNRAWEKCGCCKGTKASVACLLGCLLWHC